MRVGLLSASLPKAEATALFTLLNELSERGLSCHHLCPHNPSTPLVQGQETRALQGSLQRRLCKQQGAKGQSRILEGEQRGKTVLENAVEPKADAQGVRQEPISLPSPGRFERLWCFVWMLITQILNPLPYYEKRFADLKYWAWDSEGNSHGWSQEGSELGRPGEGESLPGRLPLLLQSEPGALGLRTSRNRCTGWAFWRGDLQAELSL